MRENEPQIYALAIRQQGYKVPLIQDYQPKKQNNNTPTNIRSCCVIQ